MPATDDLHLRRTLPVVARGLIGPVQMALSVWECQ
jgi:hypothetical protein